MDEVKIYLASPFFNDKEREVKSKIKYALTLNGYAIIDPQEHEAGYDHKMLWEMSCSSWGRQTFDKDARQIENADVVVAIDWGLYGDCGTAWEIGFAFAKGKPVIVIVPDEVLNVPHSLMIANGSAHFVGQSRFIEDIVPTYNLMDITKDTDDTLRRYYLEGVPQK